MQRWKQVWGEPPCVAEAPVWEADGQSAARGACSVLWVRSWETPPPSVAGGTEQPSASGPEKRQDEREI